MKSANAYEINRDIDLFFGGKTPMIERERFATNVVLDSEYPYTQSYEHDVALSRAIFSNETQYLTIKNRFQKLYFEIAKKPLSTAQKGTLIGIGVLSAAALFLLPIALAGGVAASAATTTSALAAVGLGDMQIGIGVLSLCSAMAGGAAMGVAYHGMAQANRQELKNEFQKLDFEEAARLLTIRTLLIERSKIHMSPSEVKENISDFLMMTDDFRSDVSYKLFVEHSEIDKNKEKIQLFHNFDKTMMKVCAV